MSGGKVNIRVFPGATPVAPDGKVPQVKPVLNASFDGGYRAGDL